MIGALRRALSSDDDGPTTGRADPPLYWLTTEGQRDNATLLDQRAAAVVNADWKDRNAMPFGTPSEETPPC